MKKNKLKITILCNDTTYLKNTRLELIDSLKKNNYEVLAVCQIENHKEILEKTGCKVIEVSTGRQGTNPFKDILLFFKYIQILYEEKPDIVLSYNIKPNVYGGLACRLLSIKYMPNITGLGTAVEYPGKLQKLTILLYKLGTYNADCIFFQNTENLSFFKNRNMLSSRTKTVLLPGSGVALDKYSVLEYPNGETTEFVYVSRILKEKGIDLYIEAAKYARNKYPDTIFHICGGCDDKKYIDILEQAQKDGYIQYHGEQKNMIPWLEKSSCLIHPSYYPEGMSNVLLEAAASGRPVITTDRAGCRETTDDGITGFVVPIKNQDVLNEVIDKFMAMTYEQRKNMGLAGRKKVEQEFDRQIVVEKYMEEIGLITKGIL